MKYPVLLIGSLAIFIFDQSSNHRAFRQNALLASRMTLNEKPAEQDKSERFGLVGSGKPSTVRLKKNGRSCIYIKRIGGSTRTREVIYFKGIKNVRLYNMLLYKLLIHLVLYHRYLKNAACGSMA
jgi:hypothetical protein